MSSFEQAKEEIRNRIDIVEYISRTVDLKKAGINYKGLCPFHHEKTPSFIVSETRQTFHCFGCGKGGDVFTFCQEAEGLTFMEAMEKLAGECGVTIEQSYGRKQDLEEYYEINREAALFFYKTMRKGPNPGWDYMIQRGLSPETMKAFGIGYADSDWHSLLNYLKEKGFDENKMMQLGLISESKGKRYDKFRERVIFPIINTSGKVIGFGGRALGDAMPKYLNSNESPVFQKKNNLYGLNLARDAVHKEDCAILVEGYMDVISLYQSGVQNVAASLGTALTENQASLLKRYTKNVVLCYDADNAGKNAALRGMDILHKAGSKVRVMHVSDGKDPDEFVKQHGKEAFRQLVGKALPFADYKLHALSEQYDMNDTEQRVEFLERAADVLNALSPVEADIYLQKLSEKYGVSEGAIRSQQQLGKSRPKSIRRQPAKKERQKDLTATERSMIKILMTDAEYFDKDSGIRAVFTSTLGQNIFETLESMHRSERSLEPEQVMTELSPEEAMAVKEAYEGVALSHMDTVFKDCIRKAQRTKWKAVEKDLIDQLSMADETENAEAIRELTEKLVQVQQLLRGSN